MATLANALVTLYQLNLVPQWDIIYKIVFFFTLVLQIASTTELLFI